jgi:hypothetical protein
MPENHDPSNIYCFFKNNEAAIVAIDAFVTGTLLMTPPVPLKSESSTINDVGEKVALHANWPNIDWQ